ncbi:membrane-bound acid phosphatase 2 [Leptomonas pyrrhocoris]|uniref:Membrane-bound acid phosphatase 2 n=1 Tax=Leptomonas pyrrhocoris TaxID=157538 RepID=A0A0M9G7E2_LEPPY|nr:membrane-bound acid phosphatase 2 [Leptomonas pyrrhocoris]KPA83876.1 membrane-bound acid phosphatase 2 [Leptomonas pyrrhocoris]|eukprot:XP_015662315.1 membrane-bound acid phosphatase 2 [Leptomonas pyrrhocoris]
MRSVYVFLQAVLLLCLPAVVLGAPDLKLVMVQLLHRHGARAAETTFNMTQICGDTPCGYLSWAGIKMLNNTGAFLRNRYNTDPTVVTEPMFPSLDYDLDVAYSRSTDVLRTLQSAESFLRGFFPNLTSLYPAIHTMPENDDYLLYTNYAPQYQFFYNIDKPSVRSVCNPTTDKNFPDFKTLTDIGKEVYSEGYCSTFETRSDCARKLFDIAAAMDSVGTLDAAKQPLLKKYKNALAESARVLFEKEYEYDRTNTRCLMQGSAGQPILQEFVTNINTAITAKLAGTTTYKLFHYSAHDTTLSRIACSLQDKADDGLLPPFSQVLVLELLENETDKTFYVRVLRGHPGQSPDTEFKFDWEKDWSLTCMDAWQTAYPAKDNTCPVADFARFVQWSAAPATSKGYCYLDEKYQELMACPKGGIHAGDAYQPLSSACQYYRNRCPAYSCEEGYLLNSVSQQCVCVSSSCSAQAPGTGELAARFADEDDEDDDETTLLQTSGMTSASVAAVALGSLCVGVLVAAFITSAVCLCSRRPRYAQVEHA